MEGMNYVLNLFKKKKKEPKSWVRFHSLEPGLAECYPVKPTSSIKRAWQEKETKDKNALSKDHRIVQTALVSSKLREWDG
ncbi:MAG: hypothetical protein CM15mV15_1760 [uncultured marine virus]|nr:MAG: hypothetical protein CM15mV15_1760 [uncultured marine virus]